MKAVIPALLVGLVLTATPTSAEERSGGTITFVKPLAGGNAHSMNPPSAGGRVPTGSASRRASFWPVVLRAARAHGLDPVLVDLVIRMESGYNPFAISPKGARGLMQLLPSTARAYGVSDIFDPQDNISGGVRYLSDLMGRFGKNVRLSLAAYNAGPEAVERYGGVPPYRETRRYVEAILGSYRGNGVELGRVTGGFGRQAEPAPVVEREEDGRLRISNVSSPGEAKVKRRLSLQ